MDNCPSPVSSNVSYSPQINRTPLRLNAIGGGAGRIRKQSIPRRSLPRDATTLRPGHVIMMEPMIRWADTDLMHRYGFMATTQTNILEGKVIVEERSERKVARRERSEPKRAAKQEAVQYEVEGEEPSPSNPNIKPTITHGHHLPEDLDPEVQVLHSQWYNELYRHRRSPSALAALGQVRTAGFGGTPLDISGSPGHSLLMQSEFDMCCLLRLQPLQYFQSRHTLLLNMRTRGFFRKSAAQKMLHIDVNKTGRLYDFFVKMRWIPEDEAEMDLVETPPTVDWRRLE